MGKDSTPKKEQIQSKSEQKENGKNIGLQVLSDKQIASHQIPKDALWYILVKGEPVGPFHRDDLKKFLEANPTFPRDTKVANVVEQKWLPLFKIPDFQRRKPQIVPNEEIPITKEYILLKNGQKTGPFSLEQLLQKVESKEILFTDLVTFNQGESWIKLYEHPHFDRRERGLSEHTLPHLPHDEIFSQSYHEVLEGLKEKLKERDEEEGLIGLAYMGKLKAKTSTFPQSPAMTTYREDPLTVEPPPPLAPTSNTLSSTTPPSLTALIQSTSGHSKRWKIFGPALLAVILGGGFFLYKWKSSSNSPTYPENWQRSPATQDIPPAATTGSTDTPQNGRVLHPRYRPKVFIHAQGGAPSNMDQKSPSASSSDSDGPDPEIHFGQTKKIEQAEQQEAPPDIPLSVDEFSPLTPSEEFSPESIEDQISPETLEEFTDKYPEEGQKKGHPAALKKIQNPDQVKRVSGDKNGRSTNSISEEILIDDETYTEEDLFAR